MIVRKILEKTLSAGQTQVSFTDSEIPNSLIRVYSDDANLMPVTMSLSSNTLTITYEAQESNKGIALEMVKSGLEIVDNLDSTDDSAALSAKQGKVLKDLVDNIIPIRSLIGLDDVLVTNLTDGDILKYNAEDEVWENYLLPDVPVYLGDLGDVVLDTVTAGQVLTFNGAYWTNEDSSSGSTSAYSTDERSVGTWIDGRTVYQKSFVITTQVNVTTAWTDIGIVLDNDVEAIVFAEVSRSTAYAPLECEVVPATKHVRSVSYRSTSLPVGAVVTLKYVKTIQGGVE